MSVQKAGTKREETSTVAAPSSRPRHPDVEFLDDLKQVMEQRTSSTGKKLAAAPTQYSDLEETSVPHFRGSPNQQQLTRGPHPVGEDLPSWISSDRKIKAAVFEDEAEYPMPDRSRAQSILRSNLANDAEQFAAEPQFRRQRQEATFEDSKSFKMFQRRGFAITGYAMLALILAGGVSFAAVQLLSALTAKTERAESEGRASRATIPATNQPLAMVSPRLRLSKVNPVENGPLSLGISVESALPDSFILIRDLPPGSQITTGSPVGSSSWRVPLRDLAYAMLVPPESFVGTMVLPVDLKNGGGATPDSDVQHLSWTSVLSGASSASRASTAITERAANLENERVASLQKEVPAKPLANPLVTDPMPSAPRSADQQRPRAAEQPARQIPQMLIDSLLVRANTALETGDIAAARLLLQRAAEAGNVKAALALASTYDPEGLRRLRTLGAPSDVAEARRWYERAAELGDAEATQRLKELH
jgi:hypothetical protein